MEWRVLALLSPRPTWVVVEPSLRLCRPSSMTRKRVFSPGSWREGPIPAVHGVLRWRACDLIMRLHEEFGLSVSDDTILSRAERLGLLACEPFRMGRDASRAGEVPPWGGH